MQLVARTRAYRFLDAHTFEELLSGIDVLARGETVHVHWTTPIAQQAPTRDLAAARLTTLGAALDAARRRGVRLVWTVHNRLPHELPYPDIERSLYQHLSDRADIVHVMAPATADILSDIVRLDPSRVRMIPHPSYEGIYDSGAMSRALARESFNLDDERAVLFLGQIRPYKGVRHLVEAVTRASDRPDAPDIALLLAGTVKEMSRTAFESSLPSRPRTIAHLEFVPDSEVERWFLATDVAVFPYRAILNSGSVHLAASFRVPVILPDEPHLRQQFRDQEWVRYFDPSRPSDSIADLLAQPDLFAGVSEADFEAYLEPVTPWRVSRAYAALLDELSGGSRSA